MIFGIYLQTNEQTDKQRCKQHPVKSDGGNNSESRAHDIDLLFKFDFYVGLYVKNAIFDLFRRPQNGLSTFVT